MNLNHDSDLLALSPKYRNLDRADSEKICYPLAGPEKENKTLFTATDLRGRSAGGGARRR